MDSRLYRRKSTSASRGNVLRHLQNTMYVSFIKEIYEEVLIYCGYALHCAAITSTNANRLIGEQQTKFSANDILEKTSKEEIFSMVIEQVFRKSENKKDTLLLVSSLNDRLNLGMDKKIIEKAMPYLEARHKFVHSDGLADEKYKTRYPQISLDNDGKILLNKKVIKNAAACISNMILEYEKVLKDNSLFPSKEFE